MINEELKMLVKDYDGYMDENHQFFDDLKEKESLLYFKIKDILNALKALKLRYDKLDQVSMEEVTLFEIGMQYLYDFKVTVEAFNTRLNGHIEDCSALVDIAIDLNDYIEDFDEVDEHAQEYYDQLEDVILNYETKELEEDLYNAIEKILCNADYISILECFDEYCDEMDII